MNNIRGAGCYSGGGIGGRNAVSQFNLQMKIENTSAQRKVSLLIFARATAATAASIAAAKRPIDNLFMKTLKINSALICSKACACRVDK